MVDGALMPAPGAPSGDGMQPATLSAVYKCWAELDLESLRGRMDDTGLKIAEFQDEALQNRRKLAESTREFKRTAGDTPVKGLGALLKQYQEEIDRLTKRCKHSESAFLELYQKLYEAPDPAPALALAFETASRVADLEAQNRKLSAELADFEAEAASIKNQDLTIRRLEDKVRQLEAALEEKGMEIDEVRVQAVAEADAARLAQMQERETQLTAMLAEAQASLAVMQKLHTVTQNQLFAMQSQGEDERMSRQSELELASAELDRAQERLMALEREKQQLQQQLTTGPGTAAAAAAASAEGGALQGQASGAAAAAAGIVGGLAAVVEESMRQELYTQREVAARLRLEVTSLRQELDQANSMWEARVEGLRASMQATEQHARALEEQLANRPTNQLVEELRSQIRMLQAVGLNALAEDDMGEGEEGGGQQRGGSQAGGGGGRGGGAGGSLAPGSLEAMLLQKNRHLEHALTTTKLLVVDTRAQLDSSAAQIMQLQAQLGEKVALVARLEEDLLESRKGWGAAPSSTPAADRSKAGSRAQLSGLLAAGDGASGEEGQGGAAGAGEEAAESSMVRVVCAQRDRFRARVQELEEQLVRTKGELQAARSEAAAARADNIALVERLRYVHGFKQGGPISGRAGAGAGGKGGGGDVEVGADAERRYGRLYDEGINPFKEFQGEQRERQKSQLHFADKLMYMFGQLVFGSTPARLGTFAYLVIMHLLVVGSLLRMTHHSSGALYAHTQHMLGSRHDVMASMHHDTAGPGAAGAGSGMHDSRLP